MHDSSVFSYTPTKGAASRRRWILVGPCTRGAAEQPAARGRRAAAARGPSPERKTSSELSRKKALRSRPLRKERPGTGAKQRQKESLVVSRVPVIPKCSKCQNGSAVAQLKQTCVAVGSNSAQLVGIERVGSRMNRPTQRNEHQRDRVNRLARDEPTPCWRDVKRNVGHNEQESFVRFGTQKLRLRVQSPGEVQRPRQTNEKAPSSVPRLQPEREPPA